MSSGQPLITNGIGRVLYQTSWFSADIPTFTAEPAVPSALILQTAIMVFATTWSVHTVLPWAIPLGSSPLVAITWVTRAVLRQAIIPSHVADSIHNPCHVRHTGTGAVVTASFPATTTTRAACAALQWVLPPLTPTFDSGHNQGLVRHGKICSIHHTQSYIYI